MLYEADQGEYHWQLSVGTGTDIDRYSKYITRQREAVDQEGVLQQYGEPED